jgi:hypothetical protein
MTYRGDSMGGFAGHHLAAANLEALRPAADNAGRIATVGTPGAQAVYHVSQGDGWQPLVTGDTLAGILHVIKLTQAAYDGLGTKDANTLYVIVG